MPGVGTDADMTRDGSNSRPVPAQDAGGQGWTALVLAGERPGGDPLAASLGLPLKAMIPINGMTMLDRVLSALLGVATIDRIVVLTQRPENLPLADPLGLIADARVDTCRSNDGIAASIAAIAGTDGAPWPLLVTTADNALLTPARVEAFLAKAGEADITVGVGERAIVEAAFPAARRTWLKFSDGHYSGANLFALTSPRCLAALGKWAQIEQDRKKGLKLIASFGPALLLRAVTRTIAFPDALARAGRRLGCTARPVVLDAEAPIDVDKPDDLALVTRILVARR